MKLFPIYVVFCFIFSFTSLSDENGKVVFSISDAQNSYVPVIQKDDMDEFEGYRNIVGCNYEYLIKNRTNKKIKIKNFAIALDADYFTPEFSLPICGKFKGCLLVVNTNYDEVIKPNDEQHILHYFMSMVFGGVPLEGLYADVGLSEEKLTNKEAEEAFVKYGCEAQKGKVYLTGPGVMEPHIVYFSKKEKISDSESFNYIAFEKDSPYPLKKGF